jgi:glycerol-3-phosphate acyltransferase PlsY
MIICEYLKQQLFKYGFKSRDGHLFINNENVIQQSHSSTFIYAIHNKINHLPLWSIFGCFYRHSPIAIQLGCSILMSWFCWTLVLTTWKVVANYDFSIVSKDKCAIKQWCLIISSQNIYNFYNYSWFVLWWFNMQLARTMCHLIDEWDIWVLEKNI